MGGGWESDGIAACLVVAYHINMMGLGCRQRDKCMTNEREKKKKQPHLVSVHDVWHGLLCERRTRQKVWPCSRLSIRRADYTQCHGGKLFHDDAIARRHPLFHTHRFCVYTRSLLRSYFWPHLSICPSHSVCHCTRSRCGCRGPPGRTCSSGRRAS